VWIYTGYLLEELQAGMVTREILTFTNVLVDGKFEAGLKDTKLLFAGSSNQRIHKLK
jgi:anaerobic ribonucleoside-triphosphate reductase activating protein